ncbi:uncharacterized protein LOC113511970 isoform X2 [Galleria mellonella]|uniref:Uncharacterized protein LOC113511970 isoform X2 n=1 Tax=Galleria mellonella TaxID=7137 RepID=A0A6J1WJV1_GALME|nr:uncharacterized protein LOC113511970 isoform X2 [Galleria mellonella]
MGDTGGASALRNKLKMREEEEEDSEETWDSEDDDETIARIQRAHFAQAAAMNPRRRAPARPKPMSHKRKMEAVKHFHDFTKKLKKDTGIRIRSLVGNNILELSDFSSEASQSDSDGLSEEEFVVNPSAVQELNEEDNSYIDPETGDIVEAKKDCVKKDQQLPSQVPLEEKPETQQVEEPKTLSISDIINEGDLDLTKNVEIAEVEEGELCPEKSADELLGIKQEESSQDFDITEKLKEMGEISVKPVSKKEEEESEPSNENEKKAETEDEKKSLNTNALNVRRNIREVMDEKNLDASTLAAQRQESERLARVQEQQRIIREVQRQIALNRQNKIHQKTLSLLQGGSSILKKIPGQKLNLPNTVLVKLPSGEIKKTMKQGQVEVTKVPKPTTSGAIPGKVGKMEQKTDRKEVVEIVDSSSGEESSSSSSDSDDCIMLSDSEVPPSPEAEEDPHNSGLHVNDAYNIPDEQGRVLINIGHPENEEDIFLAPQIARIIKPHQIGGVRFLFDNIIESVERFSTSTGFGCILAHSMGLGKTLQIVCFCDIFLRHTKSNTVLCIMPINTLQNWVAEFNMWLPLDATNSPLAAHGEVRARNFPIYVLNDSHKTLQMRAKVVKDWSTTGGVLMIGYELYRLLSMKKDKKPRKKKKADAKQETEKEKEEKKTDKLDITNEDTQISDESKLDKEDGDTQGKLEVENKDEAKKDEKKEDTPTDEEKKLLDEMYEALVRPGPDLVICDEGHRIKNSHSNISYALKQMRTKRRIVLTGYPLQNNLLEYWCMVDFVRPNYLGSKTEFCNMFERPIQNGQCIDSTPQDIRLMRYRAHVLHSLLVGFVQRRSHAVLQSTLPQKEEYVLLVRMTPLQRKLYDRFMNEVVRSTSVPNPLKAFAICCKIWNHPDVLYNFLKKRSEANAAIEEDLDLEELGGVTKAGRARNKAPPRRAAKPRGNSKKPAATIPPNTTTAPAPPRSDSNVYGNPPYPPNGPYGPPNAYRPEQPSGSYPPYPNYPNPGPGYYPPNQNYNQNYDNNYYQQQPPYNNDYPNQYPSNNSNCTPGYNQNYWGNGNYYGGGNSGGYLVDNAQYPNNQPPHDYRNNPPPEYNNPQQYPPNYNTPSGEQPYPDNAMQPYSGNQEAYGNQQRPPYPTYNQPGYPEYSANTASPYQNNTPSQEYPNHPYPPPAYAGNSSYPPNTSNTFNHYDGSQNYPGYPNAPNNQNNVPPVQNLPNQPVKTESTITPTFPTNETKPEPNMSQNVPPTPYGDPSYAYQTNTPSYPDQQGNTNGNYPCQYPSFPAHLETKPPLGSASSGSPVTSWPITEIKTEIDKLKSEEKIEMKSESDGEVKIEDLDTKKIVKNEIKKQPTDMVPPTITKPENSKKNEKDTKSDVSESEEVDTPKKGRSKGKGRENKKSEKAKPKSRSKAKGRKDRKKSKEKNDNDSESEDSDKEEKPNREEELAMVKKAEEMTYDWASELLKDYIPGIIENSAKMELFFYILNESIKLGDRILLFSQSLFTLNLIEDFLEKNYIPGTNCLWERNTSYYRLDGSTHALEREKLINEFNTNPHIYLFLVSTRAGSLGINLVGANRVIVFDASWNPCHDTQAVCRVYRYGQRKPCFVYRFVMDWCLEKKIYDRQINKQGMADRVVDECNPDAVLSMKEITNLCFDNDEKESEPKDLSAFKDKYIDVLMQGIISDHGKLLSKEPFQHESLLVDRKEKKLSSAEKRLAQRGYELEKKAALAPKPAAAYRTVRTADGSVVQRPVASVRPMQHGARWIPADVWRRQGMTAQEMTLPLDVVIPTNSAEKTNIVLKAGQRVMVLKSPKGIYMQLESGKIIAIKTSFKGLGQKGGDNKDNPVGKKGGRPTSTNIPGSLKNNSAITITSKTGARPGYQRVLARPSMVGQNKLARPMLPGQKIADIRNRLGELRAYSGMRPRTPLQHGRIMRPNLSGSVSITKITKDSKKSDNENNENNTTNKMDVGSEDDTQVLDSDDEVSYKQNKAEASSSNKFKNSNNRIEHSEDSKSSDGTEKSKSESESKRSESIVLTTDEKLPPEENLETKTADHTIDMSMAAREKVEQFESANAADRVERKINLLKNYRHQRLSSRPQTESSLSQLERTASVLNKEGMPDFRKNLDDITQSYSPSNDEKPSIKSKKKKSPNKSELAVESQINERQLPSNSNMSHSVTNLLSSGNASQKCRKNEQNTAPVAPLENTALNSQSRIISRPPMSNVPHDMSISGMAHPHILPGQPLRPAKPQPTSVVHAGMDVTKNSASPNVAHSQSPMTPQAYPPANPPPEGTYGQYPAYGMPPYGTYPNPAYYGGYGSAGYYGPYSAGAPPYSGAMQGAGPVAGAVAGAPPLNAPDYLPPNPQW